MRVRSTSVAGCLACLVATAGCASAEATNVAHHDFSADRTFYVVERPQSDVHLSIQQALVAHGYDATTGPADRVPAGTDVVVTFVPHLMFGSGSYLVELDLTFARPGTGQLLATGKATHPTVGPPTDPQAMAADVVDKLLTQGR